MLESWELTETSPVLERALRAKVSKAMGLPDIIVGPEHTGGGVMVMIVDLSINGIEKTRQLWLTREDTWYLGFYDFGEDEEDEGIVVSLEFVDPNNAQAIAATVAGIVKRMGIGLKDKPSLTYEQRDALVTKALGIAPGETIRID